MAKKEQKTKEPKDTWFRILVLIISGVIFYFWNFVTAIAGLVNLIIVLIDKKPNKPIVQFVSIWLTEITIFLKYVLFIEDKRPFPFADLQEFKIKQ
jgi:hypothetical protein